MCRAARSDSVATVTADKNEMAKLLGLGEVGVPRISHDSGAQEIHSRFVIWLCVCRLFTRSDSIDRAVTVADAG